MTNTMARGMDFPDDEHDEERDHPNKRDKRRGHSNEPSEDGRSDEDDEGGHGSPIPAACGSRLCPRANVLLFPASGAAGGDCADLYWTARSVLASGRWQHAGGGSSAQPVGVVGWLFA
jgi:hypothetical protein